MSDFTATFITLSNYIIPLFAGLFALFSYVALAQKSEEKRVVPYVLMGLSLVGFLFSGYGSIYIKSANLEYLFFFCFQTLALFAFVVLFLLIHPGGNRLLLFLMAMEMSLGFMMIARLDMQKAVRQFEATLLALTCMLLVPIICKRFTRFREYHHVYAMIGIISLALVLLLGTATHGSKVSFTVLHVRFQPSEIIKIVYLLFLASALRKKEKTIKDFLYVSLISAAHVLILVASKDLGSALIFFMVYLFVCTLAFRAIWLLALGLACASGFSVLAYRMFPHIRVRVKAFLDPWSVIDGQGYQIAQSLFAISRGGAFGLGFFGGSSKSIPYVEQDFMFSAVAEELGMLFAVILILICLCLFLTLQKASMESKFGFDRLFLFGASILYIFQVFLTVGGGVKFIPLTGVTLPFVSAGGSSILSSVLLIAFCEIMMMEEEEGKPVKVQKNGYLMEYLSGTLLFVMLLLATMVYMLFYVKTNEVEMVNNSYNATDVIYEKQTSRGNILARDGQMLAQTKGGFNRSYPYHNVFSHIVGYNTKGRFGIEAAANYYLLQSDVPLAKQIENQKYGRKNPGNNVYTTLDPTLQKAAYDALGAYNGAIVVTKPSTGEVLAMVSKPDFDPEQIDEIWDQVSKDEDSSVLVNRAINGIYPPGSTFKIVTALEYMREYPETFSEYSFKCGGSFVYDGEKIHCYHGTNHGLVSFKQAFAKSCNSSFADISTKLNQDAFASTCQSLLFDQEIPFELPVTESHILVGEGVSMGERMQTAIGQGRTTMSPFHLNLITCAIANDGVLKMPYVLDRVVSADGNLIKDLKPNQEMQLMTPKESYDLSALMREVVDHGTGTKLSGKSYTVAGKTGSAEYNKNSDSHAWFTGFAPAVNPEVCITVVIEGAGSGGDYAVPTARRVLDAYFER